MKKFVALLAVVLACVVVIAGMYSFYLYESPASPSSSNGLPTSVLLDGQTIQVTVANTDASRELGLGGRSGLASNQGMLFVFPEDGKYAFWMKDMHFSIDMVWIAADHAIVYMAQNVSPDTYPENFVPSAPARYVLELPAGYAQKHNVKVGDIVQF